MNQCENCVSFGRKCTDKQKTRSKSGKCTAHFTKKNNLIHHSTGVMNIYKEKRVK